MDGGESKTFGIWLDLQETPQTDGLRLSLKNADAFTLTHVTQPSYQIGLAATDGDSFPMRSAIASIASNKLADFTNHPNPFDPAASPTSIQYYLRADATVTLSLYTLDGQLARTLADGASRSAGGNSEQWWGDNDKLRTVHSGVYLCYIRADYADGTREEAVRKIAVLR